MSLIKNKILQDLGKNGKEKQWGKRKKESELIALAYKRLEKYGYFLKIEECATWLKFLECPKGHERRLVKASFCRKRLCAMCVWRKSLAIADQVRKISHVALKERPGLRFIFLTLTVPNCEGEKLSEVVTEMFQGWKRLTLRVEIKQILVGYFRTLEVTYNRERNDYHPHFHVLLAVPSYYFTSGYIKRDRWLEMWQEATRSPLITQVDIRKVKPKKYGSDPMAGAAAEVAKYETKASQFIQLKLNEMAKVVDVLHKALHGRRAQCFAGLFREIKKKLKLKDIEEVDFIDIGEKKGCFCLVCQSEMVEQIYRWSAGQYVAEKMLTYEESLRMLQVVKEGI